jgi:hypothetical protein
MKQRHVRLVEIKRVVFIRNPRILRFFVNHISPVDHPKPKKTTKILVPQQPVSERPSPPFGQQSARRLVAKPMYPNDDFSLFIERVLKHGQI